MIDYLEIVMPGVLLSKDDSIEFAYMKFKRQVDRNLIITEKRARRFFEPKTEKRKKQKISARKKMLRRLYMIRRYEARL